MKICTTCNIKFIPKSSPKQKYCSKKCFYVNQKGRTAWNKGAVGPPSPFKGIKNRYSEETIFKIRNSKTRHTFKKGYTPWNKGKNLSKETRKKMSESRTGEKHPNWKGGKQFDKRGYVYLMKKDHPSCVNGKYIAEHRYVMEQHVGRLLTKEEVVHHINGIVDDNCIENLKLFKNNSEHIKFHKPKGRPKKIKI